MFKIKWSKVSFLVFCLNLSPRLLNLFFFFFFLTAETDIKMLGTPIFPAPHCTPLTFISMKAQGKEASALPNSQISRGELFCMTQVDVFPLYKSGHASANPESFTITCNVSLLYCYYIGYFLPITEQLGF